MHYRSIASVDRLAVHYFCLVAVALVQELNFFFFKQLPQLKQFFFV